MCMSMYLNVCMYTSYRAQESQKKSLNLLELELQVIVSHHMGAGTESGFSAGTASIFNCWVISPAPIHLIFGKWSLTEFVALARLMASEPSSSCPHLPVLRFQVCAILSGSLHKSWGAKGSSGICSKHFTRWAVSKALDLNFLRTFSKWTEAWMLLPFGCLMFPTAMC